MKWNWGTGITIVLILFVLSMAAVVYMAMNQRVDLVRDDYYEQELRHQDRIDAVERTRLESAIPRIQVENHVLLIAFGLQVPRDSIDGKIHLYRPSDRTKDLIVPLQINEKNGQSIPVESLERGLWRVKFEWTAGGRPYFHEESFFLQ